jgi:hypothetical protein
VAQHVIRQPHGILPEHAPDLLGEHTIADMPGVQVLDVCIVEGVRQANVAAVFSPGSALAQPHSSADKVSPGERICVPENIQSWIRKNARGGVI